MAERLGVEGEGETAAEAPSRSIWQYLESAVLLSLLGVGLYYLVPRFIGDREMLSVVRGANFLLVPAALGLETLSMLCVCRLHDLALRAGGESPGFPRVSLVYMSAYAFGHVVPGGNSGTFYLNYRELRREGVPWGLALKAIAAAYLFYSAGMVVLLAAGSLLSLSRGRLPGAYRLAALVVAGGAVLFLAACVFLARRERLLRAMAWHALGAAQRLRLFPRLGREEAVERFMEARRYLLSILDDRGAALRLLAYGTGFWLLDMSCLYVVFLALGHPVNPGILMACYAFADIMGSLPLTPAGLGVFEASLGATLYAFGYAKEVVATAVLGFRFFSFWLCTLAGGACYLPCGRRGEGKVPGLEEGGRRCASLLPRELALPRRRWHY